MKTIIALFSLIIYSTVTFAGDPIPGAEIKKGRHPRGGDSFASAITDKNGAFEFINLTAGKYSYYLDFAFKQTGKKGSAPANVQVENIKLLSCTTGKTKAAPTPIVDRFSINTVEYGQVNLTITYDCNSIKGKLEKADPKQRGVPINTSRSNIKSVR